MAAADQSARVRRVRDLDEGVKGERETRKSRSERSGSVGGGWLGVVDWRQREGHKWGRVDQGSAGCFHKMRGDYSQKSSAMQRQQSGGP